MRVNDIHKGIIMIIFYYNCDVNWFGLKSKMRLEVLEVLEVLKSWKSWNSSFGWEKLRPRNRLSNKDNPFHFEMIL